MLGESDVPSGLLRLAHLDDEPRRAIIRGVLIARYVESCAAIRKPAAHTDHDRVLPMRGHLRHVREHPRSASTGRRHDPELGVGQVRVEGAVDALRSEVGVGSGPRSGVWSRCLWPL